LSRAAAAVGARRKSEAGSFAAVNTFPAAGVLIGCADSPCSCVQLIRDR